MAQISIVSQSGGSAGKGVNSADLIRRMSSTGWINPLFGGNQLVGTWAGTVQAGNVTGSIVNTSDSDGDSIRYTLYYYPGTYTFYVNLSKNNDRGKVKIDIGGVTVMPALDLYSASIEQYYVLTLSPLTVGQEQTIDIDFTVNGKNASSTGYRLMVHGFEVRRIS